MCCCVSCRMWGCLITVLIAFLAILLAAQSIDIMSLKQLFSRGTPYRNIVWYYKGMQEFTREGYEKASRQFDDNDLEIDISNRIYMVTGSNSGLGKSTALALAKKGATVHMVCRNQTRGEEAKQDIIQQSGNDKVHLHVLDISKSRDVVQFACDFVQSQQPLDVLVNNAGCMVHEYKLSEDGLETNFATNTLGTYILTTELLPALQRSSNPQVVTVSSGGMLTEKLEYNDFNMVSKKDNFDGIYAYCHNKRQQVVMSRLWATQYPNIHFSSMHPGWADTPGVRTALSDFFQSLGDNWRTPEQGADTIIWLCIATKSRQIPSGLFFQDRQAVSEHLPLAWSQSTEADETNFMRKLDELKSRFLSTTEQ